MELNKIESKLFGRICYSFTRREDGSVINDEEKSWGKSTAKDKRLNSLEMQA